MMNRKQQIAQDKYLKSLLGDKCQVGYHSDLQVPTAISTLGRQILTTTLPESSRKAEAN